MDIHQNRVHSVPVEDGDFHKMENGDLEVPQQVPLPTEGQSSNAGDTGRTMCKEGGDNNVPEDGSK